VHRTGPGSEESRLPVNALTRRLSFFRARPETITCPRIVEQLNLIRYNRQPVRAPRNDTKNRGTNETRPAETEQF
jgi:hypothetical protein